MNYLTSREFLNAFRPLTQAQMATYVGRINAHRPVYIYAYAQSLYELAKFIRRSGVTVHVPKAIATTAAPLHEEIRKEIQQAFQCPVFDRYGTREVGVIAGECLSHRGLHVPTATHYVETVDASGTPVPPGQMGDVLVTSLLNFSMPLIRYRLGDMAILSDSACSCGCGYPLIERIVGRGVDIFVTSTGDLVDGAYFVSMLMDKDYLTQFRIVQETVDRVRVLGVPSGEDGEAAFRSDMPSIEHRFRAALGSQVQIDFEVVPVLEPLPSGKLCYTISHVSH